jgi:purine-binding chemotaxis protein CheW
MPEPMTPPPLEESRTREGRYLTFALEKEEYGIEILKVRELIGMMDITSVPRTAPFVRGVINLRGKIIPVVDLRLIFGMPRAESTRETCIVVVDLDGIEVGTIVDRVSEVLNIPEDQIEDLPSFGAGVETSFVRGMAKLGETIKTLLDIDRVLASQQVTTAEQQRNEVWDVETQFETQFETQ